MFELRVETAPAALKLMEEGWPTRIYSLVGDDLRFELPHLGEHHFIARFHDVESEIEGYTAPSAEVLSAALRHAQGISADDRVLVHCHAGKSRSPALAIAILVASGLAPKDALERVKSLRPFIIPNRRMVALFDDLLGLDGELNRVVEEHYSSLPTGASLPDRGGWNV